MTCTNKCRTGVLLRAFHGLAEAGLWELVWCKRLGYCWWVQRSRGTIHVLTFLLLSKYKICSDVWCLGEGVCVARPNMSSYQLALKNARIHSVLQSHFWRLYKINTRGEFGLDQPAFMSFSFCHSPPCTIQTHKIHPWLKPRGLEIKFHLKQNITSFPETNSLI